MNPGRILEGVRIGCVKYLNALPLIGPYEGAVHFEHPAVLAQWIWDGKLDAGLVPVYEALRHPGYAIVDGVGICSDGPVYSVFLAHRLPLESVRTVSMDAASLTSINLLRVLFSEFLGIAPKTVHGGQPDARLLIGNQAIEFRRNLEPGWEILDLGELWKRCTRLPFVYAVWMVRPGVEEKAAVAEAFRWLKSEGLRRMEEWRVGDGLHPTEFRRQYLGGYIRYELGSEEKRGLEEFRRLLEKHGALLEESNPLVFI